MIEILATKTGICVKVLVVPRASRSKIIGEHDGALRIRLAAPPVDGAANKELIRFLSKELGIPKSRISIRSGLSSRRKSVLIDGVGKNVLTRLQG